MNILLKTVIGLFILLRWPLIFQETIGNFIEKENGEFQRTGIELGMFGLNPIIMDTTMIDSNVYLHLEVKYMYTAKEAVMIYLMDTCAVGVCYQVDALLGKTNEQGESIVNIGKYENKILMLKDERGEVEEKLAWELKVE